MKVKFTFNPGLPVSWNTEVHYEIEGVSIIPGGITTRGVSIMDKGERIYQLLEVEINLEGIGLPEAEG